MTITGMFVSSIETSALAVANVATVIDTTGTAYGLALYPVPSDDPNDPLKVLLFRSLRLRVR